MKALILLNPQIDFCEGGALEIPGAKAYLTKVKKVLPQFSKVICLREIHPANHLSFAANHPWRRPGQEITIEHNLMTLMISHCVEGQFGSFTAPPFQDADFDEIITLGNTHNLETDRELCNVRNVELLNLCEKYALEDIKIMGFEHNNISKHLLDLLAPKVPIIDSAEILKFKEL